MAVNALISVLLGRKNNEQIHAAQLIDTFISENWRLLDEGRISYLPLNDDDNFEWQRNNITTEKLMDIVNKKEERGEAIGVLMLWDETNVGVQLLIHSELEMSFSLNVNRRTISSTYGETITDVSWYIERIIGLLRKRDYIIESFSFEEY